MNDPIHGLTAVAFQWRRFAPRRYWTILVRQVLMLTALNW